MSCGLIAEAIPCIHPAEYAAYGGERWGNRVRGVSRDSGRAATATTGTDGQRREDRGVDRVARTKSQSRDATEGCGIEVERVFPEP